MNIIIISSPKLNAQIFPKKMLSLNNLNVQNAITTKISS